MNVDGNFEFYKFIWSGADQGWGVYSFPPMHGIEVIFIGNIPSANEIKTIRKFWPRLKNKTVLQVKDILGTYSFVFGKWSASKAKEISKNIATEGVNAVVVEVPSYLIVNMKTNESAQIRSEEIYDQVVDCLLKNGGEVVKHSGEYPSGGLVIKNE